MPRKNSQRRQGKSKSTDGFRISDGPVVPESKEGRNVSEFNNVGLAHPYDPPVLFAIARDPRTIFTYWNIDWPSIFEKGDPVDRQVHLRLYRADGIEETNAAVEPLVGHYYLQLPRPNSSYQVEIGYYQSADVWHSVAQTDVVTAPRDDIGEAGNVDLATIPLHLSFQRLLDLFGAPNRSALAERISKFQTHALDDEKRTVLSRKEREVLRATNISLPEMAAARRAFADLAADEELRNRSEAILNFGSTSPARGFSQSSWNSGAA